MRKPFLVSSMLFLAGCLAAADGTRTEDNEEVEVASQESSLELPQTLVFEEWSDLAAFEPQSPPTYQLGVDVLVASGVDCLRTDGKAGHCLVLDEIEATAMLEKAPAVRCGLGPQGCWLDQFGMRVCEHKCCADIVFTICGTTIVESGWGDPGF